MVAQVNAFYFFLALAFFVLIFYWPWQRLCVDWARQEMFKQRDNLYLLSRRSKEMPTDSDLHIELRTMIDSTIRFCHFISWPRLVTVVGFRFFFDHGKAERAAKARKFSFQLKKVTDSQTRTEINRISRHMALACMLCLMSRSIILGPIALMLLLIRWAIDVHDFGIIKNVYRIVLTGAESYQVHLQPVRPRQ
jgi:hypothetical protein